jgi:glycosyltransferase involved in cell wall biosynthesis
VAHVYPVEQRDIQPGISAILVAPNDTIDLDAAVLDLAAVLDGLVYDNFEIVVVDVASNHRIAEMLTELRVRFPHLPLRLLDGHYPDEPSALSAAFDCAAYDLIFVTSADGQYDMRELNHLLDAIEHGADLAIGYRPRRAAGIVQRIDGWGWNLLINVVFGRTARDVDCAFKLFRQGVWQRVGMRSRGTATFYTELLVRARRLGFRVTEVPVKHHRSSSAGPRDGTSPAVIWRALIDLKEVWRRVAQNQSTGDTPAGAALPVSSRAA